MRLSAAAAQVWGKAVSLPGRALAPVISRLKTAGMAEADAAALADFHAGVVALLTGGRKQDEVDGRLAQALPGLKRLANLGGGGGGGGGESAGGEADPAAAAAAAGGGECIA